MFGSVEADTFVLTDAVDGAVLAELTGATDPIFGQTVAALELHHNDPTEVADSSVAWTKSGGPVPNSFEMVQLTGPEDVRPTAVDPTGAVGTVPPHLYAATSHGATNARSEFGVSSGTPVRYRANDSARASILGWAAHSTTDEESRLMLQTAVDAGLTQADLFLICEDLATSSGRALLNVGGAGQTASIDLTAGGGAPGSEILIVSDSLGPWLNFAYAAGWANLAGALPLRYRRVGDLVHLIGTAVTALGTGGLGNFGTMPAGFRPTATLFLHTTGVYAPQAALTSAGNASVGAVPAGGTLNINEVYPVT